MLNKSRRVLEAKTKLYNRMSANGGGLNSDDSCLVMFNKKKQTESSNVRNDSSDDEDQTGNTHEIDDNGKDGEWVEYTDCLGRTRKCLKEDLDFFKKKDIDLAGNVAARQEHVTTSKWFEDTRGSSMPPPPPPPASVQQKTFVDDDDTGSTVASKIDEMRANWDKQEEENINKDYVHYQDILFDGKHLPCADYAAQKA